MDSKQTELHRRQTSLDSNILYWTKHLIDDKDAKGELARCKQLYIKLLKDIEKDKAERGIQE